MDKEKYSLVTVGVEKFDDDMLKQYTALNNELINAKRELTKSNIELQKLLTLKNQFLSIASHDLRSPLGAIQYFSKTIADDLEGKVAEETINFLNIIHDQSKYMLRMVEDLLDYTRMEDGNQQYEFIETDIRDIVSESVTMNKITGLKKNISLCITLSDNPLPVKVDKVKIQQVVNNILGNAIKFSYPDTEVEVTLSEHNGQAQITIQDKGVGIAEDDLNKIFEPFYKGVNSPTGKEPSTGLGLAIVKRIIDRHSGSISVSSTPDKGSCFTISLPTLN